MSEIHDEGGAQTPFEAEFGFQPLGDDAIARIQRLEVLLTPHLRTAMMLDGGASNYHTIHGVETLPVPRRELVIDAADTFRDKDAVAARKAWDAANPDLNP